MEAFLKRPISHRGLHDNKNIIENTLESFDASINKNFATECDIILSKDEEVMVFHDFNLKRLTEINMLVNECNASDLRKIKLLKTNSVISSLDEMLYRINSQIPILIEIKESFHPKIEERLLEVIRTYRGEIAIQSFDFKAVKWFKQNAPFYKIGLVSKDKNLKIQEIIKLGVDFLSFNINHIEENIVKEAKKEGFPILAWTVDTKNKYNRSLQFADNAIFEKINIT